MTSGEHLAQVMQLESRQSFLQGFRLHFSQ